MHNTISRFFESASNADHYQKKLTFDMQVMHNINSDNIDQLFVVKQYGDIDQVMYNTIRMF